MSSYITDGNVDPWTTPAATPPPGVTPNFVNPRTLNGITIGVVTTMLVISTALVLYNLLGHWRKMKLHDYTVLLAMVLMYGFAGLVFALLPWARHQWDLPLAKLSLTWGKILLASEYFLSPTILVAKVAILLMYLQIFGPMKWPRRAIYAGILFNCLIYLPNFGITGALCSPHPGEGWTLEVNVRCNKSTIWGPIQGTLSVVDDIYIFVLPIPVLMGLQVQRPKRVALLAIFGTALLGIAASVVGLVYRVFLWKGTRTDVTWNVAVMYICMIVEVNVAIIISIMPAVAGLAKTHFSEDSRVYQWWHSRLSSISLLRTNKRTTTSSSEKGGKNGSEGDDASYRDLNAGTHERAGSSESNSNSELEGKDPDVGVRPVATPDAAAAARVPRHGIVRGLEVEQTYEYV